MLTSLVGCTITPAPNTNQHPSTQASTTQDGRNLAPGLQPYGADPQFPFGDYGRGGGGGRR